MKENKDILRKFGVNKKENKEVPDELKIIFEDEKGGYCFCRCNIINRKAEIRGPSR